MGVDGMGVDDMGPDDMGVDGMDTPGTAWYAFTFSHVRPACTRPMAERPDDTPAPDRPVRRAVILLLKVVVSVGLLAVLFGRTDTSRLWSYVRHASPWWLAGALSLYLVVILVSSWRWRLLLDAQRLAVPFSRLVNSYLVATFFNNFLPSNIGGDVVRIRDTAGPAGSKTTATTIILMDRGLGLLGLLFVAALGSNVTASVGGRGPVWTSLLWAALGAGVLVSSVAVLAPDLVGRVLSPLRRLHQEWVDERIGRLTSTLTRFRSRPQALLACFAGAIVVQAVLVVFYLAIARSMHIPISVWHLAVIVPVSFVVQMAPISLNGFGVREATFTFYFSKIGLPIESALVVSFMGAGLIILFSLSGAAAYLMRGTRWSSAPEIAASPPGA
jgi:glycosyltransferase 2 family protein